MTEIWNLSTICRCCHLDGNFKNLREPCKVGEGYETYESILRDVFAIAILQITTSTLDAGYTICDQCIQRLRDAASFKRQILECEQKFYVYCKNEQFLLPPVGTVVKVEGGANNEKEDVSYDGDDDCKGDEKSVVNLKREYKIEVDIQTEKLCNYTEHSYKVSDKQDTELWEEVKIEKEIKPIKEIDNKSGELEAAHSLIQSKKIGKCKTYKCKKCKLKFDNKKSIKKHIFSEHKEVTSYPCDICNVVFLTRKALSGHRRLHNIKRIKDEDGPSREAHARKIVEKLAISKNRKSDGKVRRVQCDLCQKYFACRSTLTKHLRYHYGTNKAELCEQCGRGFNDRTNLRIHINTVHNKLRPYICDICGRSFTAKKNVKAHIIEHMYGKDYLITKRYQCEKCAQQFKCPSSLSRHQLRHDNKFPCTVCNKIFNDKIEYKAHKHAPSEIKYACPICNRELSSNYTLNRHIDGHNGIRRFPCDKCPLKFIDKAQLKRHTSRIHNPDNPRVRKVQCAVCKRHVEDIDRHMTSHASKKFSCTLCNNSYVENKSLKRHMKAMHLGRVYTCDVCNKKVISMYSLTRHRRRVHKIFKSENDNDDVINNGSEVLDVQYNPMDAMD